MLNLIGLGLFDEKDLSLRAIEALKSSDEIYVELYTNYYHGSLEEIEKLTGKKIIVLERSGMEEEAGKLLEKAEYKDISVLIPGDPLVATTHIDLALQARKKKIKVNVIHSSSVYSAVGETGLQIYKFGKTTTIAYPEGSYFPMSPYDAIKENLDKGLHTLCLLDVKASEDKYMSVNEAIELLLKMESEKKQGIINEKTMMVGVARLGGDVKISYKEAQKLLKIDFGEPPQILIIPGKMHPMEMEALELFSD